MSVQKIFFGLFLLCVFYVVASPVLADDAAQTAYDNGKYEEAMRLWDKQAKKGKARAQNKLGDMYRKGRGVDRNYERASQWYRLAARQGHTESQFNLGALYRAGKGVKKDPKQAAIWYRKSAKQGYANTQFTLGVMLENGRGIDRDRVAARKWYVKAAAQKHHKAAERLKNLKAGPKKSKIVGDPREALRKAARTGDLENVLILALESICAKMTLVRISPNIGLPSG